MFQLDPFIASSTLYSVLRLFDVMSTKLCLAKLDPEMHEVNPIVAPLVKRIGFYKTMFVTWLPFAVVIGYIDAEFAYPAIGIPIFWLLFGLFHLIASANNLQVYFQIKTFGAQAIENNTRQTLRMLKKLSFPKKLIFLMKANFLNLFFAIYGIVALTLFMILLGTLNIYSKGPIPTLLALGPPIMIVDLILFFPIMVFGSLLISLRRLRLADDDFVLGGEDSVTITVELLETVLNEARGNGASCVQFPIRKDSEEVN